MLASVHLDHQPLSSKITLLVEVAQTCRTLCGPMDCSPPGSSVHGIFQARILEWVATSFSRGSSRPRDQTRHCRQILYHLNHQGVLGVGSVLLPLVWKAGLAEPFWPRRLSGVIFLFWSSEKPVFPLLRLRLSRLTSWPPSMSLALTVSNHIFLFSTLSSFLPPLLLVLILFDLTVFSFSSN